MLTALLILPSLTLLVLLISIHYCVLNSKTRLTSSSSSATSLRVWNVDIDRSGFSISLWTDRLNSIPQKLLNNLNYRAASRLKRCYDIGVGLGLVGCATASGVAIWAWYNIWKDVWREAELHAASASTSTSTSASVAAAEVVRAGVEEVGKRLTKRAMEDVVQGASEIGAKGDMLLPLIPGVTIPLSHLPTLVLAFVVNQLIHEFGHAISASLDDIQPSRLSFNLHLVIPSMMISFPSTVDQLDPNAKMRLASSGPVHNLMTWFTLWLLTTAGAGGWFWYDRGGEGKVVEDVHWASPLYAHLQPGDLITHLDDVFIGDQVPTGYPSFSTSTNDRWSSYLSSSSSETDDLTKGWCMDKTSFLSLPYVPCESTELTFTIIDGPPKDKGQERCMVPHPILDIPSGPCPCPDPTRWVCIRPSGVENLLRIRVRPSGGSGGKREKERERVVLWNGPREEVKDAVAVGIKAARGWNGGVRVVALFLHYLSTIALSLYLFNLLPLPYTDGSQLLLSLLSWRSTNPLQSLAVIPMQATLMGSSSPSEGGRYREFELDSEDEEELVGGGGGGRPIGMRGGGGSGVGDVWKRRLRRVIVWGMTSVVLGWIGGWTMLLLLRSS
ncbi:hypothetical protein CI109_105637 [Kwoniella shandongensis]|uniref:Endopeptidase S2P n=1 Tax=Kwoniella shandongensis TaxID=1734106 RepID=A0A5M6C2U3_9TREE|nr:uncharacterized protein CI109_002353 [Kwoniella shandongensis]KAA5529458.1 hypothetical protein CI109_002353 [Kwoniella shandongensis]